MRSGAKAFATALLIFFFSDQIGLADAIQDFKIAGIALSHGDYPTALRLFHSLAAQGMPGAKWALGFMYFEGRGVPQDYAAALGWYRQAADQGHPLAQYELGAMYDGGYGVKKNPAVAAEWFGRAAAQGYGKAEFNLAAMYVVGAGVPQNYVQAYKWFSLSATGGSYLATASENIAIKIEADRRRNGLAHRMTPEQMLAADRLVREWRPEPELALHHF